MNLIEQDKLHRQLALDAGKSFIVKAPAGSGKTELLIQRFLTLLAMVNKPEEILAITFTKKAANEMRSRVIKALKTALHDAEPESAHARQTLLLAKKVLLQDKKLQWNLIDNPNQLRIQTIDSLCSSLTRQLPILSHFGSQPDISDYPESLYREAIQEILLQVEEENEWGEALRQLLLHLDNDLNKFQDLLVNLLMKRDQWLPFIYIAGSETDLRLQLENQLALVIKDSLSEVIRLFPSELMQEMLAIARFAAAHVNAESDLRACETLNSLKIQHKKAWTGIAKLLLTKSFNWRKRVDEEIGFPALKNLDNANERAIHQGYRQRLTEIIGKSSEHEDLRTALEELFFLPDPHYTDTQWEILQSLLQILKLAAAQLRIIFQLHGKIDFIENTQAALQALGDDEHPADLALALDCRIQHILVDEFQDTSWTQYQLLEKLTRGWEEQDGRSLFIVGDPMQSIYRFREAEVGLFIRMCSKGLHQLSLTPLTLAVNFRSSAGIVEWNNRHFSTIFPAFNDMASGAVSYSQSVANEYGEADAKTITINGFINSSVDTEAEHIVQLIHETSRQYPSEKIAILVRSRPHLAAIIPGLKKAKIAYRAIDIDPLASRQCIQDVLSLTCALLHPADRISWLSILRAPWCGLTLADLLVIAGNDPYAAIYSRLESPPVLEKLSEDGCLRVRKIFPVLQSAIASRERMSLRTFVENTWLVLGGPASLNDEAELEDVKAFFQLLDEFSEHNQLLNLDKLKEKMHQLYASAQHDEAIVDIMTIHSAKGLEFDTVILPQLERKNPLDDQSLLSWMEQPLLNEQMALLLAPIHATGMEKDALYEYIQRKQRIKSDYEMSRLFYVASTRAKKRLHLFFNAKLNGNYSLRHCEGVARGNPALFATKQKSWIATGYALAMTERVVTLNEKQELKVESGSFLSKIWPQWKNRQAEILQKVSEDSAIVPDAVVHTIQRVQSSWINPVKEMISAQPALHHQSSGFVLPDRTARLIGTMTHRILQMLANLGMHWWRDKTRLEKNNYITALARQSYLAREQHEFAARLILTCIENTLADERGRWILQAHADAKSEYAVTAMIDDQIENLVIDRTFVDENNTLWIIDYKTSSFSTENEKDFLAKEQKKYAGQMQKYYQALNHAHDGEIRMGLYFPALPAWCEIYTFQKRNSND